MIVFVSVLVVVNVLYALASFAAARRPYERVIAHVVSEALPSLSIVVPARNEERQIEACVQSLLAQRYRDFEVIVVDDCSDDDTPTILRRIAAQDSRLRVVDGEPLPVGWVGKPWALVQGAREALGSWLLFTDADTIHSPNGASSAVAAAVERKLDVLSLLTEQDLDTLAERALMPSLFLTILGAIGPIGDVADPRKPRVALFNGQYILALRTAYDAIGGHRAVRSEIAEDLELARLFKRDARFRIALVGSEGIARTRMYRSLSEIWRGFTKNFALGLRGQPLLAAFSVFVLVCLSPLSPLALVWLILSMQWIAAGVLTLSTGLVLAISVQAMRLMKLPAYYAVWYPVGTAFTVAVLAASMTLFASGRGVYWRGRRYGAGRTPSEVP